MCLIRTPRCAGRKAASIRVGTGNVIPPATVKLNGVGRKGIRGTGLHGSALIEIKCAPHGIATALANWALSQATLQSYAPAKQRSIANPARGADRLRISMLITYGRLLKAVSTLRTICRLYAGHVIERREIACYFS